MLTPLWHYVAGDGRLPQVAASPRPLDLPAVNPLETPDGLSESQTKNKWSYKLFEEKKPNRKRGRKQLGSRNKGVRCTDTKPAQLSKHGGGSSPPVGDVVAKIWVRWAGSESRNPGLMLESCRAITSSRLGRESLMPSLARSCYPLLYSSASVHRVIILSSLARSLLNLTEWGIKSPFIVGPFF